VTEVAVLWRCTRPPSRRALAAAVVAAAVVAGASAALLRMLMLEPDWTLALALSGLLAVALIATVARGALVEVGTDGLLTYGFGRRDLQVPLAAITGWRMVATGALAGVGARVEPGQVVFLTRKGPTYRTLERYAAGLGTALVLEHLTSDDLADLRALQQRVCGHSAPRLDVGG
jgi:hypothetical protein